MRDRKIEQAVLRQLKQKLPYQDLFFVEMSAAVNQEEIQVWIQYLDNIEERFIPHTPFNMVEGDELVCERWNRYIEDLEGHQMGLWLEDIRREVVWQLVKDNELPSVDGVT